MSMHKAIKYGKEHRKEYRSIKHNDSFAEVEKMKGWGSDYVNRNFCHKMAKCQPIGDDGRIIR